MNRLRELREQKKLSLRELANELNVSYVTIAQYETGKRQPDNDKLIQLANYFHVSVDYLLGISDNKGFIEKNNNYFIPDSIDTADEAVEFLKSLNLYAYGGLDLRQKSDAELITLARTILSTLKIQGKL